MQRFPLAGPALAAAVALALAPPAVAQTDFTAATKVECTPESMTRCTAPDKCTTQPASARDKSEIMIIDFAAKKASIRRGSEVKEFAAISADSVEGGVRRITLTAAGSGNTLTMTLTKDGKLMVPLGSGGNKADAVCTAG
jgi:hypothetical protein